MYERHVTIEGVTAVDGSSTLVGINSNYGDTATIKSDTCVEGVETVCAEYEGNDTGDEVSFSILGDVMLDCAVANRLDVCDSLKRLARGRAVLASTRILSLRARRAWISMGDFGSVGSRTR
jgi:hypothetical protein